jgi:hypothetical protein
MTRGRTIDFQADITNLLFQPKGSVLMTTPAVTSDPPASLWPSGL